MSAIPAVQIRDLNRRISHRSKVGLFRRRILRDCRHIDARHENSHHRIQNRSDRIVHQSVERIGERRHSFFIRHFVEHHRFVQIDGSGRELLALARPVGGSELHRGDLVVQLEFEGERRGRTVFSGGGDGKTMEVERLAVDDVDRAEIESFGRFARIGGDV